MSGRQISRSLLCRYARFSIIGSKSTSITNITLSSRQTPHFQEGSRRFLSAYQVSQNQSPIVNEETLSAQRVKEARQQEIPQAEREEQREDETLPWYLQVREPSWVDRRPNQYQDLPELPSDSPPLLETLLRHISVDAGLDDLKLLDLRSLEPPSALGANLIMVVCTARSEKHLHVSADRFCRYLRSEHKLKPHADGLLGRGELKIRMRRRAKRIKVLAHAGTLDTRMLEEELRTGWVCVMVDGLEPSSSWVNPTPNRASFIGFDERGNKVTLVVQMLTEARRAEMQLENLWSGRATPEPERNTNNLDEREESNAI